MINAENILNVWCISMKEYICNIALSIFFLNLDLNYEDITKH